MSESHKKKTKSDDAATDQGQADESQAGSFAGQASDAMSKAADMTKDITKRASDAVGEGYGRVSRGTQDAYHAALATGEAWEENLERYIRRNPITSLLVTAGVGVLLGFALGRETAPRPPQSWWRQWTH
jgi:ElaB/YqjD/DUF883 family membrane-anchored ribosome-binding protein